MIRDRSFTDALAIAAGGFLQLLVRFRWVDKRIIEHFPIFRREGDFLMRIDDTFGRRHRVRQHEIGHACCLIRSRPLKLTLGLGVQTQVHAVSFHVGSLSRLALLASLAVDVYAQMAYTSTAKGEFESAL